MLVLDAAATAAALPFDRLLPALSALFAGGCVSPPRHLHEIAAGEAGPLTSLIMPAWLPGRYYGVKVINIAPANAALGLPALHASYLLHDARTGVPLASIDGDTLTHHRTAATAALAAGLLARADASRLVVVGAGRVAALLPQALSAVRPLAQVSVWARSADKAAALAASWRATGLEAAAAGDLQAAVRDADIVSCATLATEPLVHGRWLRPGSHLDLIGSFTPEMREADDCCFAGAAVCIDTDEALQKSGDLLGPMARGVFAAADVRGTLAQLVRAGSTARRSAGERTVFKAVGSALADLAAAMLAYETVQATAAAQAPGGGR